MNNEYEAKEDRMKRYLALTSQLISNFDDVKITWVPEEENSEADEVARLALSKTSERRPGLLMEVQYLPSIKGIEVNCVWSGESWMDPIITYIETGNFSSDLNEARKVKVKSSRSTILNDELYKRGFSQAYLKCLDPGNVDYVLREIHEGDVEIILDHVHSLDKLFMQGTSGQQCRKMQLRSSKSAINTNNLGMCNMSRRSI